MRSGLAVTRQFPRATSVYQRWSRFPLDTTFGVTCRVLRRKPGRCSRQTEGEAGWRHTRATSNDNRGLAIGSDERGESIPLDPLAYDPLPGRPKDHSHVDLKVESFREPDAILDSLEVQLARGLAERRHEPPEITDWLLQLEGDPQDAIVVLRDVGAAGGLVERSI